VTGVIKPYIVEMQYSNKQYSFRAASATRTAEKCHTYCLFN
jgi:hypothetical protein